MEGRRERDLGEMFSPKASAGESLQGKMDLVSNGKTWLGTGGLSREVGLDLALCIIRVKVLRIAMEQRALHVNKNGEKCRCCGEGVGELQLRSRIGTNLWPRGRRGHSQCVLDLRQCQPTNMRQPTHPGASASSANGTDATLPLVFRDWIQA